MTDSTEKEKGQKQPELVRIGEEYEKYREKKHEEHEKKEEEKGY